MKRLYNVSITNGQYLCKIIQLTMCKYIHKLDRYNVVFEEENANAIIMALKIITQAFDIRW